MVARPFGALHYYVEMKGITEAIFTECSGLQVETEVYEYKEGGVNTHVHRLPGRSKVNNITLKRGIARPSRSRSGAWDNRLWTWYANIMQGKILRTNMSIILFDTEKGSRVATWNLVDAYPVKWIGPTLRGGESAVAIETLELAHGGIMLE